MTLVPEGFEPDESYKCWLSFCPLLRHDVTSQTTLICSSTAVTTSGHVRQGPILEAIRAWKFLQFLRAIQMEEDCQLLSLTSVIWVTQFVQDLLQLGGNTHVSRVTWHWTTLAWSGTQKTTSHPPVVCSLFVYTMIQKFSTCLEFALRFFYWAVLPRQLDWLCSNEGTCSPHEGLPVVAWLCCSKGSLVAIHKTCRQKTP